MKKIIHFHFYTHQNIGDAAVVYSIRDLLEKEFKISQYTSKPIFYLSDFDFGKFYIENLLNTNVIFKKLYSYNFFAKFLTSIMKFGKFIKGTYKKIRLVSLINKHDLMIVGGGGLYGKWTLPFDVSLINKVKIPIVIFGAGYNRTFADNKLSAKELNSIRVLNKKAKLCSVRDEKTLKIIKSLGIDASLTGDPAIFLESKKVNMRFDRKTKKIGLNIAYHDSQTKLYSEKVIKLYTKLIKNLEKNYKIHAYYLKHSSDEIYIAERLKELIPSIQVCEYGPREMKYIYEKLDLVISMMLHSSIFAYSSGTNFINIAYNEKNYAFMRLINNMGNLIDMRKVDFNKLYSKCLKLLNNTNEANAMVKKDYFRKRIDEFVADIKMYI